MQNCCYFRLFAFTLLSSVSLSYPLIAQTSSLEWIKVQPTDRIVQRIDSRTTIRLPGNTHPMARRDSDAGPVPGGQGMDRMVLVLGSDANQEKSLEKLLSAQQDPSSPLYHQWLTPAEPQ